MEDPSCPRFASRDSCREFSWPEEMGRGSGYGELEDAPLFEVIEIEWEEPS